MIKLGLAPNVECVKKEKKKIKAEKLSIISSIFFD
jgi:hypothetical protein